MQELAKRAGFSIEYSQKTPLPRCFRQMATGETDLISNLNKTPEREAIMLMFPYSENIPEAIYQRGNDDRIITQLNQLSRMTIATVRGYNYQPDVMTLIHSQIGKGLLEIDSIGTGFEALAKGRIDGFIVPRYSSLDYLHNTPKFHQKFKLAPFMLKTSTPRYVHIGLSRKSKHTALAARIEQSLQEMMADGTVKRLYAPDAKEVEQLVLVQP